MNTSNNEVFNNYFYPGEKQLKEILFNEIKLYGKITFSRFMEIVLYDKMCGYYNCKNLYADYLTSPHFSNVFGKLTGKRLFNMWLEMKCPKDFYIIEIGCGDGLLARQILDFLKQEKPEFYKVLKYIILGINSAIHLDKVSYCLYKNFEIPLKKVKGCFLSNELPDSFPVHIVCMDNGTLKEVFVGMEKGELVEIRDSPSGEIYNYFNTRGNFLSEGHRTEVNVNALKWIRAIGQSLEEGYIMTIDYGYNKEELLLKKDGTLLCFYKHTFNSKPFKRLGYQDITSHVNFTDLIEEGNNLGLIVEEYKTQKDFLIDMGIEEEMKKLDRHTMNLIDYNSEINGMKRLIDDRGLGKIKVLIQRKCHL